MCVYCMNLISNCVATVVTWFNRVPHCPGAFKSPVTFPSIGKEEVLLSSLLCLKRRQCPPSWLWRSLSQTTIMSIIRNFPAKRNQLVYFLRQSEKNKIECIAHVSHTNQTSYVYVTDGGVVATKAHAVLC